MALLPKLVSDNWDSKTTDNKTIRGSGYDRMRYLQSIDDLVNRPQLNRVTVSTNATAVTCNGSAQSSGIGTSAIQPKRYGEVTIKARVTFNINSTGPAYIYVYRTTGSVPANGSAPNVGDVIVSGDAFLGGPTSSAVDQSGALSFLDTDLSVTGTYKYYLGVKGPNGNTLNLINSSQILVMERS